MKTNELDQSVQYLRTAHELHEWNRRDEWQQQRQQAHLDREKLRQANPYTAKRAVSAEEKEKKILKLNRRWISKDPPGYTWSMGYNNLVGYYCTGARPRFSGSSFNRTKQLLIDYAKDISTATGYLCKMASAWFGKSLRKWRGIPGALRALVFREDPESRREFELWLSGTSTEQPYGISIPLHVLSIRSRGKIKDKATAFFRACSGERVFCTLTFVAPVDDRTGVAILNKWLTQVRKRHPKLQYFWVAERQENGNIHFHMILNRRLKIGPYNALWVLAQYNAGLVGKDKYDEPISKERIDRAYADDCAAWEKGKNKKIIQGMLNPMDVKKVRSIAGLSSYLTKYITKQEKNVPFTCACWHCSRGVSRVFTRTTVGPAACAYMRSFANYKVDKTTGECWPPLEHQGAYWYVVYAANKSAPLPKLKEMEQINKWILDGHVLDKLPSVDEDGYIKYFKCETSDSCSFSN